MSPRISEISSRVSIMYASRIFCRSDSFVTWELWISPVTAQAPAATAIHSVMAVIKLTFAFCINTPRLFQQRSSQGIGCQGLKIKLDGLSVICYPMAMHEERQRKEITRDALFALYTSERTVRDICEEIGVTPKRLYHLLDAAMIPRRRKQTHPTVYLTLKNGE